MDGPIVVSNSIRATHWQVNRSASICTTLVHHTACRPGLADTDTSLNRTFGRAGTATMKAPVGRQASIGRPTHTNKKPQHFKAFAMNGGQQHQRTMQSSCSCRHNCSCLEHNHREKRNSADPRQDSQHHLCTLPRGTHHMDWQLGRFLGCPPLPPAEYS